MDLWKRTHAALVGASLLLATGSASAAPASPVLPAGTATPATTPLQKSLLVQMQEAFTQIAQTVEPTVVNIKAERPMTAGSGQDSGGDGSPIPVPPGKNKTPTVPHRLQATGSGVIVRPDGYILTNDHVVDSAFGGMVTVTLSDGREFPGKVYPDYKSDLAIVKIDPGTAKLPVAQFASAGSVVPGQWALAVGSPFDLQNTVTVGIISAVNRHQRIRGDGEERYYPDLIQTDAAINPGNSGGPLFNIDGQVVGINVAIESPVEGSAGVGFAIPISIAQQVATALITQGKVVRGYLGLTPEDLTPALQTQYGRPDGAFVRDLQLNSPADKAGLQAADIVTAYEGKPIRNELDLREAIAASTPGQHVAITYYRSEKSVTTTATVDPTPTLAGDAAPSTLTPLAPPHAALGLTVRRLTVHDRLALSLPATTQGVIITAVSPGSIAELNGLRSGLIILAVNQKPVSSKSDFEQAVSSPASAGLTLIVLRVDPTNNLAFQHALTLQM